MKIVSLFSGAGGLDLGFMLAGHDIVWANDFDKDALSTYEVNLNKIKPHKLVLGDIKDILKESSRENISKIIPDTDMVIGGFPCQGFSIANNSRTKEDSRNSLYLEILKIIDAKNPKYFILENVKGLENMEKGSILKSILHELEKTGTGYDVAYNVFNAANFGVPQNRERVIIIGVRNDLKNDFFKKTNSDHLKDFKVFNIKETHSKNSEILSPYNSVDLSNKLFNQLLNKKHTDMSSFFATKDIFKHLTVRDTIKDLPHEFCKDTNDILNHDGTKCVVKISTRVGNRATCWDKISPTIMGRGSGTGGPLIIPHPLLHRRMSVREVARLQTFPDTFIFHGSNSSKYRQIGNAVPPLLAYHIARIFNV